MKNRRLFMLIAVLTIAVAFAGCGNGTLQTGDEGQIDENRDEEVEKVEEIPDPIKVIASFYPYYDFAKVIGGDRVSVKQMVPDGADPHSYEPSPRDLVELEKTDVFIYNGLDMEPWIDGVLNMLENTDALIINASELVEVREYHDHDHDHDHGEYDPHIWTDPMNAMLISEKISIVLQEKDPDNSQQYQGSFEEFEKKLMEIHHSFEEMMQEAHTDIILVSHSAFGYLADRHGITEITVTGISPHAEPNPGRLAELTKIAREYDLEHIFFETLANPRTAEVLAEEAGLEPLMLYNVEGLTKEQKEAGENYVSLMKKNVEALRKALAE